MSPMSLKARVEADHNTLTDVVNVLGETRGEMHQRFDQIDQHLGQHDQRFDQHDQRFDQHDQRFDQHDQRLTSMTRGLIIKTKS